MATSAVDREKESCRFRNEGNTLFCQRKIDDALDAYNKALTMAPSSTALCYFLALSNRSAVLFEMNYPTEVIRDIDRVLNGSAKGELEAKLVEKLTRRRQMAVEKLNENGPPKLPKTDEKDSLPFGGTSVKFPAISNKTRLMYTEEKGRHLVANELITEGSPLVFERRPYASVLLPRVACSHCHHCHSALDADWLPCCKCALVDTVRYCNEACRDESWQRYHSVECGYVPKLQEKGISHLVTRIILETDEQQLIKCDPDGDLVKKLEGKFGLEDDGQVYGREGDFLSLMSLQSHAADFTEDNLKMCQAVAKRLARFLTENRKYTLSFDLLERTVLAVIQRLFCNAHAITGIFGYAIGGSVLDGQEDGIVASAIYPSTALMNHSCLPNVFSSFINGRSIVVRAIKRIEKDAPVLTCYGPQMGRMAKPERQSSLSEQYFFMCRCVACTSSEYERIELEAVGHRCPRDECDGPVDCNTFKCLDCGNVADKEFTDYYKPVAKGSESVLEQLLGGIDPVKDQTKSERLMETASFLLHKHNKRLAAARDRMAKHYSQMGATVNSISLVVDGLVSAMRLYGKNSLEVANELLKLSTLLKLRGVSAKNLDSKEDADYAKRLELRSFDESKPNALLIECCRKADKVFTTHYGPSHPHKAEIAVIIG